MQCCRHHLRAPRWDKAQVLVSVGANRSLIREQTGNKENRHCSYKCGQCRLLCIFLFMYLKGCGLPGSRLTKPSTGQQDSCSPSSEEESFPESCPSRHSNSSMPPSSLVIGSTESIMGNTSRSR